MYYAACIIRLHPYDHYFKIILKQYIFSFINNIYDFFPRKFHHDHDYRSGSVFSPSKQ